MGELAGWAAGLALVLRWLARLVAERSAPTPSFLLPAWAKQRKKWSARDRNTRVHMQAGV